MSSFTFEVYNNRRDSNITYRINKTDKGWHISYIAISGDCAPDGEPYFYMNFRQDSIAYPSGFGSSLEHVWEELEHGHISDSEAQSMLQDLADWVSACEQSEPKWKGWNA